ncbi:N(G),N(G)-dimethylarginine dimethylaminohydrolase [Alkalicella caledoniensis]|uniref:N(G),N(G)-dimethylarginine dimethylaminohydrolase n=1 Tax=Alkalicella caledoniensis TaxID=2731377 RepID=A0A7G9W7N4_ALKCA|nr:arginine deiminase family protein [Alkalicella caledoniensis]QNO14696.1 N(G),N(G)-dimethylarginine dimethylaminohydrolase [Alkalicella caledoniensis]
MFKNVITRKPSKSMVHGITTVNLGKPDYEKALLQHSEYVKALKGCGVNTIELEANEDYPDSCFVEDTALLTKKCAIITNPGAESRKGEEKEISEVLKDFYDNIEVIKNPGTVEGGDIMMVGDHFYIGLSARTNEEGARQMISFLEKYGYTGSTVPLKEFLHLKTGVSYLGNNNLLATGEFLDSTEFREFNIIEVSKDDDYSANCIWVNGKVLVPKGFKNTRDAIIKAGYDVIELDMSEFQKLDGGLSCLSLRF